MGTFTNLGLGNLAGVNESFTVPVYEGYVNPSMEGIMAITQEMAQDFYQLNSAMYVADVVHEQATMEGAGRAEAVLESVMKDNLEKLKKFFMNLWSKLKAWFMSVMNNIKNMFMSGKKFIDANKKRLNEKNVLGFKYKGRKITMDSGSFEAPINKIGQLIEKEAASIDSGSGASKLNSEGKFSKSQEEEKEDLLKAVGFDETSELTKEIRLAFFDGVEASEADDIEDFSANTKSELMDIVANSAKAIRFIEKQKTATDKELGAVVKEINNVIKNVNKDEGLADTDKAKSVAVINRSANNLKYLFTLLNLSLGAAVDGIKTASKDAERILKKYLMYKPTKEGFQFEDGSGEVVTESLLDQAMKLI